VNNTPTTAGTTGTGTTQQGQNQNNQNLVKTYQDMFERETQRAQANQARNLAAANLSSQQTAALAGYSPDMAARDAFEKQAGAYQANQNIEDELAKYGVDMMEKQHQLYKDSGYDYNPETGQYTFTSEPEKAYQAYKSNMDFLKTLSEDDPYYKNAMANLQTQYDTTDTSYANKTRQITQTILDNNGDLSGISATDIKNALNGPNGDYVRNAIMSNTDNVFRLRGDGKTDGDAPQLYERLLKKHTGDVIVFDGKIVQLIGEPQVVPNSRSQTVKVLYQMEDGTVKSMQYSKANT